MNNVCCCLILLFVLTRFVLTRLWRLSFCSNTNILKKYMSFWGFLSVPDLVDNYAKIVDERGRNLMCDRTLPSLLVLCLRLNPHTSTFVCVCLGGCVRMRV